MCKHSRHAAALGVVAALATAGCGANGGETPSLGSAIRQQSHGALSFDSGWIKKDGIVYHKPRYMATRERAAQRKQGILLYYGGGPVQVTPTVYLIFWGYTTYGDKDGVKPLLESYIGNMGGSRHNNIYTQYFEELGGSTLFITNHPKQFGGEWDDDTNPVPKHPDDAEVAQEALRGVSHFGYSANASYVVATPHGRSTPGFGSIWCAYHSIASRYGWVYTSYTNLPYMPDAGQACGANFINPPSDETGVDEGVTIVEGHEQGESVTDPYPPAGWYNLLFGEIGDICVWQNIQNDPFGSLSYTMQPMYSDATQSCVHSY